MVEHTVGEVANGKGVAVLRQIRECDVGRALADHEVDGDEALEDDGPCCVSQAVLQRTKDLCDARFARVRRDEDVLDVLGLWGRILELRSVSRAAGSEEEASR